MNETQWLPGLIVLAVGAVAGLALRGRDRGARPDPTRADLEAERDAALAALRALADREAALGVEAALEERAALERRAATAMRRLAEAGATPDTAPPPAVASGADVARAQRQGMLQGLAVAGFVLLVVVALQRGTTERTEGMGPTGRAPMGAAAPRATPAPGSPGGAVEGVPPTLQPKASARLDAARAEVAASPGDGAAWARLGYALIDAEGWIDAYNTSQTLMERFPDSPDGPVVQAAVRIAMGMDDAAQGLLDQALARDPRHLAALSYRGMLAFRQGDKATARTFWQRAVEAAPGEGYEDLLALLEQDAGAALMAGGPGGRAAPEASPGGAMPAGHPGSGMPAGHPATGMPAGHPGTDLPAGHPPTADRADTGIPQDDPVDPRTIRGTIQLEGSAPGGVLFVTLRAQGVTAGPPAAVKRLAPGPFPMAFEIGPADSMIATMPFPQGTVTLTARLDADGVATTRGPDDKQAVVDVAPGTRDLVVTLR